MQKKIKIKPTYNDDIYSKLKPFQQKIARRFPIDNNENSLMDEFVKTVSEMNFNDTKIKQALKENDFTFAEQLVEKNPLLFEHFKSAKNIHGFMKSKCTLDYTQRNLALITATQELIEKYNKAVLNQDDTLKGKLIESAKKILITNKYSLLDALDNYHKSVKMEADLEVEKELSDDLLKFLFSSKEVYEHVREDFSNSYNFLYRLLRDSKQRTELKSMQAHIEKKFNKKDETPATQKIQDNDCVNNLVVAIPMKFSIFDSIKQHNNDLQLMKYKDNSVTQLNY